MYSLNALLTHITYIFLFAKLILYFLYVNLRHSKILFYFLDVNSKIYKCYILH